MGQRWVKVGGGLMPYLTPVGDLLPYLMSQPGGKIEAEQYARLYGQWYRFVAKAEAKLDEQRTKFTEVRVFPTEAYRLAELPEIDYFGERPPVNLGANCSHLHTKNVDRWNLMVRMPHLGYQYRNAEHIL